MGGPLSGGLVGGKFGGIDLGSRLVLLLSAVEFEVAVDVNLGDPMLDGYGRFLRAVFFLVFAVTQFTLDLYVSISTAGIYLKESSKGVNLTDAFFGLPSHKFRVWLRMSWGDILAQ